MKTFLTFLWVLILTAKLSVADVPSGPFPDPENLLEQKRRAIVFPKLEFRKATVREVAAYLAVHSREFDPGESDPARKGMAIVVLDGFKPDDRFDLSLSKATLEDALTALAKVSGAQVRIDPYAIVLVPPGRDATEAARPVIQGLDENDPVALAMPRIVFPQINFRDATVAEALGFISKRIYGANGEPQNSPLRKIMIEYKVSDERGVAEATDKGPKITLNLKIVPVTELMRYVAELGDMKIKYGNGAITFYSDGK